MRLLAVFLAVVVSLSACTDRYDDVNAATVYLTDSPADYTGLRVKLASVELYSDVQGAWIALNTISAEIPVMTLVNGKMLPVASSDALPAGSYSQARITFRPEAVLLVGTEEKTLTIDAGDAVVTLPVELGIEGKREPLLLDFDIAASVVESGDDYQLRPVVSWVDLSAEGLVQGSVVKSTSELVGTPVWITAETADGVRYSTYSEISGPFCLRLPAGDYTLTFTPSTASGIGAKSQPITIADRGVTDLGLVNLSTAP